MSKIRSSETKIEKVFRAKVWQEGIRYRKNNPKYFGKPDLILASKKIVVFIDSCFWHGCKKHLRLPATNKNYWNEKIAKNKKRDKIVTDYYSDKKWRIIRVWEHDLKNGSSICKIIGELKK